MCNQTLTPLDQVRKTLQINPWSFWNFNVPPEQVTEQCDGVWFENVGVKLTREDLAGAVGEAERLMADYLGYNLLPIWEKQTLQPIGYNIQTKNRGHLVALGKRSQELLGTYGVVRENRTGDDFGETGTLDISDHADVDLNQIRVFYTGTDCEIRPVKIVDAGQTRKIVFPMYLIPDYQKIQLLDQDGLDHREDDSFATTLDVRRVYNDRTTQLELEYFPNACSDCDITTELACGFVSEPELGFFRHSINKNPDILKAYIYSGWQGNTERPLTQIDPIFVKPVTALAVTLLPENKNCSGSTNASVMSFWQSDYTYSDDDTSRFTINSLLESGFGRPTQGGYFAYRFCQSRRLWAR